MNLTDEMTWLDKGELGPLVDAVESCGGVITEEGPGVRVATFGGWVSIQMEDLRELCFLLWPDKLDLNREHCDHALEVFRRCPGCDRKGARFQHEAEGTCAEENNPTLQTLMAAARAMAGSDPQGLVVDPAVGAAVSRWASHVEKNPTFGWAWLLATMGGFTLDEWASIDDVATRHLLNPKTL